MDGSAEPKMGGGEKRAKLTDYNWDFASLISLINYFFIFFIPHHHTRFCLV
jgi:hypothetical protein